MTLKLKVAYAPNCMDNFGFVVKHGITLVLDNSTLPEEYLPELLRFSFIYSPVTILVHGKLSDEQYQAFTIAAQHKNILDLPWICNALNRHEEGWEIRDDVLRSPKPSHLSQAVVMETMRASTPHLARVTE